MRPYFCIIFFRLEHIIGISNQPSELSYVSQSGEGNPDDEETKARSSGDGEEERIQSHSQQRTLTKENEQNPTNTMSVDPNNDGTEGKESSISGGAISSTPQNPEAKAPLISRCYSEQAAMTPKTKRKLRKSYSAMPSTPLKSGIKTCLLYLNGLTSHVGKR